MASAEAPTTLQHLPPELIAAILAQCTLSAAIALSQTSAVLRSVCSESLAWTTPLHAAAEAAGVHLLRRPTSPQHAISDSDLDLLAGAAGRAIPSRAFVQLLPVLSREFILRHVELPRLRNSEWKEVFERRFLPGMVGSELERKGLDDGSVKMKGRWKGAFLSESRNPSRAAVADRTSLCRDHCEAGAPRPDGLRSGGPFCGFLGLAAARPQAYSVCATV